MFGKKGAEGRVGDVLSYIRKILKEKNKVKVLEVGCGYGRALLELKEAFGEKVETYGINVEPEWDQKLVKKFANSQGFNVETPKIHILDAGKKFPFKASSFDFIFNPATMQYIPDKALFIEETNRILSKEGTALLELEEFRNEHPVEYKNLIEIWDNGKKIDILKYLKKYENIKVKNCPERPWHYIIMEKDKKFKLNLKLIASVNIERDIYSGWWGTKSIYVVKK